MSASIFTANGTIANVTDARRFTVSGIAGYANNWFSFGKLSFASGANAGRAMEIKRHAGTGINCGRP